MNHLHQKRQRLYLFFTISLGVTVFLAIFLLVIIFANWGAVKAELDYTFRTQVAQIDPTPVPTPTPALATPRPIVEAPHLIIEKTGTDVPISWDVPVEQTIEYLNRGVAHLKGSARVGEIGNLFISGHSSDFPWKQNPYAAVFALLPKLQIGDTITIRENGKAYVYRVAETKIVNPNQVEVANQTTSPVLTLMTCYPVGSTRQRYIVHANLISSPEKPVTARQLQDQTLPEIKFR